MTRNQFIAGLMRRAKMTLSPQAVVRLLKIKAVGYENLATLADGFLITKNAEGEFFCLFVKTQLLAAVIGRASHFVISGSGTDYDDVLYALQDSRSPFSGDYAAYPLVGSGERIAPESGGGGGGGGGDIG